MRQKYFLFLMTSVIFAACHKDKRTIDQVTPIPPDPMVPTVFLKDIVIPNLPSPYYHFEYSAAGRPIFTSFASDLTRYNIVYEGNRIKELHNDFLVTNDTLRYFYDNAGRVSNVNYIDLTGKIYIKVALSYDGEKLIKLERRRLLGNDYVLNKTMTFSYYPDGNLKEFTDHRPPVNGQVEGTVIDHFEQYDDKINVDGFSLIHNDFFDHLIILPGVQFQKNNPAKEIVTGDGSANYTVDYTYLYNDSKAPATKTGSVTFTSGSNSGQTFETKSMFSYY